MKTVGSIGEVGVALRFTQRENPVSATNAITMSEQNAHRPPWRKKGFLARLIEKIDGKMAQQAKSAACACKGQAKGKACRD
jgi:hypothetical protein